MNREIVESAWNLLNEQPNLKRFYFFPAFILTFYQGLILTYQVAFFTIYLFGIPIDFFIWLLHVTVTEYFWMAISVLAVGIVMYVLTIPIADAGLLSLIERDITFTKHPELRTPRDHFYSYAFSRGLVYFRPIFELTELTIPFRTLTIFGAYLLGIRIFGIEYIRSVSLVFGCYFLLTSLISLFLSYSRFFIVFDDKHPFEAISASVAMTFDNLAETIQIYTTIFILYFRTFFTAGFFIVFPFVVSFLLTYLTIDYLRVVALVVLAALFVVFFTFIVHLNSALEIFTQTIWYLAYQDNKSRKGDDEKEEKEEGHGHH